MWLFVQPLNSLLTSSSSAHVQIAFETSNTDAAVTATSVALIEDSHCVLIN